MTDDEESDDEVDVDEGVGVVLTEESVGDLIIKRLFLSKILYPTSRSSSNKFRSKFMIFNAQRRDCVYKSRTIEMKPLAVGSNLICCGPR